MIERASPEVLTSGDPARWDLLSGIPCPVCGQVLGLRGWPAWIGQRLRAHFAKCRPKHLIMKIRKRRTVTQ